MAIWGVSHALPAFRSCVIYYVHIQVFPREEGLPMRDFANLQIEVGLLRIVVQAGLALLYAALLAFLSPFGTYRFSTVERIGYWAVQMGAWLLLSLLFAWVLKKYTYTLEHRRRALEILFTTLPMMLVTGVANNMMNGWQPDIGELTELFVSISLIGGSHTLLSDLIVHNLTQKSALSTYEVQATTAAFQSAAPKLDEIGSAHSIFVSKLPPHIRGGIISMQVEDHYVRVNSANGSAMVLTRFSDALEGTAHIDGAQVHRSWWVATHAVTAIRKNGRTAQLTLLDGSEVPVSQPYMAQVLSTWGAMRAQPI